MPTGYTASVADGTITSLQAFAMQCARAFGAMMMRDEPNDVPIPERFEPSDFYRQKMANAIDRLLWLGGLSPSEAQRAMQQEYSGAMAYWRERSIEDAQQRVRYHEMLRQVADWEPPTSEHVQLKEFMVEQLTKSLEHDCGGEFNHMPRLKRWPEWLRDKKLAAMRDVQYYSNLDMRELERVTNTNLWLMELRQSLN